LANFSTHIGAATVAGTALAGYGFYSAFWPAGQVPVIALLTTFGGILPDIDADKSYSVRVTFTVVAIIAAFVAFTLARPMLSLLAATCLALGLYVAIRDILAAVFRVLTRHRASWHSLLAAILVTSITVAVSFHCFGQPARLAWSHGIAVAAGILIHLLLDECFSIDLEGARLKRSFGTALKLFDYRRPLATAMMLGATLCVFPWLPAWPFFPVVG
jgi:membrane-bound metal-dependent hydrolase YbcI (DUF457 family)